MEISQSSLALPLGPTADSAPRRRPFEQERPAPTADPVTEVRRETGLTERIYQGELLDGPETEPSLDYSSLIREARLRTAGPQAPVTDEAYTQPMQAQRAISAYQGNAGLEIGPELLSRIDDFA